MWGNKPYTTISVGLIVIVVGILVIIPPKQASLSEPMEEANYSFARLLQSERANIIENEMLSEEFVVIREWSGGASCCLIIHAFQTKPVIKKILEHNNDFFDATELVVAQDKLELHKPTWWSTLMSGPSHGGLKYSPQIFNLRTGAWD